MRDEVIECLLEKKLVVIVRGIGEANLVSFAETMYSAGVRLLEVTFDASGKTPDAVTAKSIETLAKNFDGRMHIGAGTVLTPVQVELTQAAGGRFVISPDAAPEVIGRTREVGLVSIPGAFTPTEIQAAHKAGADFVKLFPAASLGVSYVKAIRAPLSHVRLLAVGGVSLENMEAFAGAGVAGFGIGSNIADRKLVSEGRYGELAEIARRYVAVAAGGR